MKAFVLALLFSVSSSAEPVCLSDQSRTTELTPMFRLLMARPPPRLLTPDHHTNLMCKWKPTPNPTPTPMRRTFRSNSTDSTQPTSLTPASDQDTRESPPLDSPPTPTISS